MAIRMDELAEDWERLALCAGQGHRGWWFPEDYKDEDAVRATAICRACPVAHACLDHALRISPVEGIWAGTTPRQRIRLRGMRLPTKYQVP
jgi:WhiB family transcriptional regulator, redox-sensing transcriptional regulator